MGRDPDITGQNSAELAFEDAWHEGHRRLVSGDLFKKIENVRDLTFGFTSETPSSVVYDSVIKSQAVK